jgi:hypothetical protein
MNASCAASEPRTGTRPLAHTHVRPPEVLRHVRLDQTKITYEVGVFIHLLQPKLDANSQLIMNN